LYYPTLKTRRRSKELIGPGGAYALRIRVIKILWAIEIEDIVGADLAGYPIYMEKRSDLHFQ